MITVAFEKTAEPRRYHRTVSFANGEKLREEGVELAVSLFAEPASYPWQKEIHELDNCEIERMGRVLAKAALGDHGIANFTQLKRERNWNGIQFVESAEAPEITLLPWELVFIDDEFVSLNPRTPVRRVTDTYMETVEKLTLSRPLRMALVSAAPSDQAPLLIEDEVINLAVAIGHLRRKDRLDFHEITHCTRSKLSTALQHNRYDILYFTGHGTYAEGMGYLCLEQEGDTGHRKTDPVSSIDLARMIPQDRVPNLVFLNCCQSATWSPQGNRYDVFRDVGRELLRIGVPDVVATLTSVFDSDARLFMRAFFESLMGAYSVPHATTRAREALKRSSRNTFYEYVHLSQATEQLELDYAEAGERRVGQVLHYGSDNHPAPDADFIGRYDFISEVETACLSGAKAVMVIGIGGIGKTALTAMLEKRLLEHYDPRLRVDSVVWLDLREDPSFGHVVRQIARILFAAGNQLAAMKLSDMEAINALDVCPLLVEQFGENALFTIDNCETLVGEDGKPKDMATFRFVLGLIAHTGGWKVLLTTREPFDLTVDNRYLFTACKCHLGSLAPTERVALLEHLLRTSAAVTSLSDDDKRKIIVEVGGNPYELSLFARNLTAMSDIDALIAETHRRTGEYAYLDYYVGKLDQASLSLLQLLTVFESGPTEFELRLVTERLKEFKNLDARRVLEDLVRTGLVEKRKDSFSIPPVLAFYLKQSDRHWISEQTHGRYSNTITRAYLDFALGGQ